jgi:dihydrofolate reductase
MMNLIVACDQEFSIGKDGKLLTYLPEDLKRFKKITMGNIMIMGRKTIDSLPGGRLLPNRETWILTHDLKYSKDGAHVFHSLKEIKEYVVHNRIDTSTIFVCGGAEIYQLFLPYCTKAYMTIINQDFAGDIHIPNINILPGWYLSYRSEEQRYKDVSYQYMNYENKTYTQFTL